jgi:type VI secretion system secreted protein VgrG
MKRQAEITLDAGCEIGLIRFTSHEKLGELFRIDADIYASSKVDFLTILGKPASIEVFDAGRLIRRFHALLAEADFVGEDGEAYQYRLTLRPWLFALSHNKAYRIFEDMSGLDIIKRILADHSRRVDYSKISDRYKSRPYTSQYRESDLDFLSRIMEREGIYYYFEHGRGDHVLILCDAPSAHVAAPGHETIKLHRDRVGPAGGVTDALWSWREHVRVGGERSVLFQTFDDQTASVKKGRSDGARRNPADTQDIHEYTGDFVDEALADHWAKVAMEATRARQRSYSGEGDLGAIFCGARFRLASDQGFRRGQEFVVTALTYSVDAEPYRSGAETGRRHVEIEAVTADTRWRSAILTPAPRAGPETAIVMVGGADDTTVDSLGRVRVRFLWGLPGEAPEKARSCWLRISYPSAGASFGHVALPRLGEEVIVDFLDGNPDRPIITGRVYNAKHPHPYGMPEHRTRSLYRSQSIGQPGSYAGAEQPPPGGTGYNELRFEDKGGSEEVYLRAQRNRLADIFLDDETRIRRDCRSRIGRDRQTQIRGNETVSVETGQYQLAVEQGSASVTAAELIRLAVGASSLTIDPSGITLQVGLSTIRLTETGIVIDGLTVTSRATTTQTIMGALTTVDAQGLLTLSGKPPLVV